MPRRVIVAAALVAGLAVGGGIALAVGLDQRGAARHARDTVRILARVVPRVRGSRLGSCHLQRRRSQLGCSFTVTMRALSGGTITCAARIVVARRRGVLASTFPGKPRCAKNKRKGPRRPG